MNNYLSVLMCQLKLALDCDSKNEYLVNEAIAKSQIERGIKLFYELQPDILLFPEMSYIPSIDEMYLKCSKDAIVVAGSYYENGINTTIVFHNTKKYKIPKLYPSGAEPMTRSSTFTSPSDMLLLNEFSNHEFLIKGKKIYIFNCMEYYHLAYYLSRDKAFSKNLFGTFTICSNSNTHVFEEETIAIHNHNELIYTFILNCTGTYKGKKYADGKSYIYGPISSHEKEWLLKEGINSKANPNHILSLNENEVKYVYGKYYFPKYLSRFGRSDHYLNTPQDLIVLNYK
ncbi:MAG: hypothetical protein IJ809_03775 [Clostridia bacterium]|nr:hypothetical protein [Clostridia bacterium]